MIAQIIQTVFPYWIVFLFLLLIPILVLAALQKDRLLKFCLIAYAGACFISAILKLTLFSEPLKLEKTIGLLLGTFVALHFAYTIHSLEKWKEGLMKKMKK